jgi:hypothetical protein
MHVPQASRLAGRQDLDAMEDTRLLVQTQFGKRLILSTIDANKVIPLEADNEE